MKLADIEDAAELARKRAKLVERREAARCPTTYVVFSPPVMDHRELVRSYEGNEETSELHENIRKSMVRYFDQLIRNLDVELIKLGAEIDYPALTNGTVTAPTEPAYATEQ